MKGLFDFTFVNFREEELGDKNERSLLWVSLKYRFAIFLKISLLLKITRMMNYLLSNP